ncbi:response regulator transcription factor [Bacillus sp. 31A1R]|uniref:Response regulator transcription factor n=1 Tax=Robertmurraya mangrovi TaxID=3098077 RepID=A0ABU5J3H7_9BACI|nr:response regulator transcription factor [Bacillus sp. 31A1R]MDZ5473969.1 response regulator transcription factor [Bacillus sp. 31A1R]
MIRVIIADDHAIVRSGITMLINSQGDMKVIATAMDGEEVVQKTTELKPDVVVMDLNMPPGKNGLFATKQLKELCPEVHIIVLTMHDDKEYIFRVLQAGASGYILKSAEDMDLVTAIRTVFGGEAYLYPKATKLLIESYLDQIASGLVEDGTALLTSREEEVLSMLAKGYSNKEVAETLYLSVKTIEAHKSKIMEKLNLRTRPELVKYALKHGLLDFE